MYSIDYTEQIAPDGTFGNDSPIGLREITAGEFAASDFFHHLPRLVEYRQIVIDRKFLPLTMFWGHDGCGVALERRPLSAAVHELHYWAFGCIHKWKELGTEESLKHGIHHEGMFHHVYLCERCGRTNQTDSSG